MTIKRLRIFMRSLGIIGIAILFISITMLIYIGLAYLDPGMSDNGGTIIIGCIVATIICFAITGRNLTID